MKPFSSLGLGTLHMGSLLDKQASKEILMRAVEKGVSFFDTAPLYGNGCSEEILGKALSEIGARDAFICTKAGLRMSPRHDGRFGVEVAKMDAQNLKQSVEASLKKLGRERIDLLMLHAFDPSTSLEETVEALSSLHRNGKVSHFGCSNYNPKQLRSLLRLTEKGPPLIAAQCHYNLIERRAASAFIPLCEKKQIWVVVNRALARGALSGQYLPGQPFRENSRAAISPRIQKWLTGEKLTLLDSLSTIARESGASLMNISLKWLLKNHSQVIILLGVRSKEQLDGCLDAVSTKIDDAVFEKIEAVIKNEQDVYKFPPRFFEK